MIFTLLRYRASLRAEMSWGEICETDLGGEGRTGAAHEDPRIREVHMEFVQHLRRREPSRIDTEVN